MDSETFEHLYEEADAPKHDKLVDKVLRLNRTQHLRKPSRTEPTLLVSEFNLVKSITGEKGSIEIADLTKPLKDTKSRVRIGETVKKLQKKGRTLPTPLEKPQAERIRRRVAYEKSRLEMDRWESTVTSNRVSINLTFPLKKNYKIEKGEVGKSKEMFRIKSKLEEELEKIKQPEVEEYKVDVEQEKFPLTMKEMLARRREAAKLRAYQGYQEAKARRTKKIKSKAYHRRLKKLKIKTKLKEFEVLQKTDPEEALRKLDDIEKCRAQERFSLRHKSTGKWARNQQIRAKFDKESRQNLAQQLTLSKDLTQKSKVESSDSDDEENEPLIVDKDNPWMNQLKQSKEVEDFITGYRKHWLNQNEKVNERKDEEDESKTQKEPGVQEESEVKENEPEKKTKRQKKDEPKTHEGKKAKKVKQQKTEVLMKDKTKKTKENKSVKQKKKKSKAKVDLSLPLQKKTPQIDESLMEEASRDDQPQQQSENLAQLQKILSSEIRQKDIDPEKFLKVSKPTQLSTAIPDLLTTEENEEESHHQRAVISEAFEDDDIMEEFDKEKENEIDKNKPKGVNLALPGWGSWGGTNIKLSKRKKKRFMVKVPTKVRRRDDNKGFLIINEKAQKSIKEHKVSEVPFPFKSVKDFEASMRAPISNSFIPETAFRKLIRPVVRTRMGAVIEPISKEILINKTGS